MTGPVILTVHEDPEAVRDVERELTDRYARHYRVMSMRSSEEALARLDELATAEEEVALVLAGQRSTELSGCALLDHARHLHPHAKRGLLIEWGHWGDRTTGEEIFDAIAHGRIDNYVVRPGAPPDELFQHV